jgi:hypothetical protein
MTDRNQRYDPKGYETHQTNLESRYIEDYLRMKGCCKADLCLLPNETARKLMIEACRYASMKLAEHEARAKLRKDIRCE